MLKYILTGIAVKGITGFDDTLTHIPIMATVTRTRLGKIAFSIGTLMAILFAITLTIGFAEILLKIRWYKQIFAFLLLFMAIMIPINGFIHYPRKRVEKKIFKISAARFSSLIGIGFLAGMATVADDIVAYMPFVAEHSARWAVIIGIVIGAIAEILLAIYFSEQISKIKYKDEITAVGLAVLAALLLWGVI